jgi:hypothetical protein
MTKEERKLVLKLIRKYSHNIFQVGMVYCRNAKGKYDDLFVEGRIPFHNSIEYFDTYVNDCIFMVTDPATLGVLIDILYKMPYKKISLQRDDDSIYHIHIIKNDETIFEYISQHLSVTIMESLLSFSNDDFILAISNHPYKIVQNILV